MVVVFYKEASINPIDDSKVVDCMYCRKVVERRLRSAEKNANVFGGKILSGCE
jgi:hypothetical protein